MIALQSHPSVAARGEVYDSARIADYLVDGFWQDVGFDPGAFMDRHISFDLGGLNEAGRTLARSAMAGWTAVTGLGFSGGARWNSDIVYSQNAEGAYTTWSTDGVTIREAQINVSGQWMLDYGTGYGTYSQQTFLHEIGHALGLGHAGPYNGTGEYALDRNHDNDTWQTSVMSYFAQPEYAAGGASYAYLATPMIADILAIERIYGPAINLRIGDTTYGRYDAADPFYRSAFEAMTDYFEARPVALTIVDHGGVDTLDVSGFAERQIVDLREGHYTSAYGWRGNIAIMPGTVIENAIAGSGADVVYGNNAANRLDGGAGNNTIYGGAGADTLTGAGTYCNDWLDGGAGADLMLGGHGNDTLVVHDAADRVDGGVGTDLVRAHVSYGLPNLTVENLTLIGAAAVVGTGNSLANVLTGSTGANRLLGLLGDDTLAGGGGRDTLIGGAGNDAYHADADDVVVELAGGGTDTCISTVDYTLPDAVENLRLTGAATAGTGNALANTITGTSAANLLDGGAGADRLIGGAGNDTYLADASDRIVEAAFGGIDTVRASSTITLAAQVENLVLEGPYAITGFGNALGNRMTGNNAANRLFGGDGGDILFGGAGRDSLTGGAGNDLYYLYDEDSIAEVGGGGHDSVSSRLGITVLAAEVEDLTLLGTGALRGIGNVLANRITGNAGDNQLNGRGGDDRLTGGAGADVFVFDGGRDVITDFRDNLDTISLSRFLTVAGAAVGTAAAALAHAHLEGSTAVFEFDRGHQLRVAGVTSLGSLLDDLVIA